MSNLNVKTLSLLGATVVGLSGAVALGVHLRKKNRPKPRVTYFNIRGLGELPRMLLAEAGIEFDDVRLSSEEWKANLKKTLPFEQLPFYEEGNFSLVQSNTIARYIAGQHGLRGSSDKVAASADMAHEGLLDIVSKFNQAYIYEKKEEQLAHRAKVGEKDLGGWVVFFEKLLEKNGDYYAGEFTYADVAIFIRFSDWLQSYPAAFAGMNRVKAHIDRIGSRPRIAKWIETRPKTDR